MRSRATRWSLLGLLLLLGLCGAGLVFQRQAGRLQSLGAEVQRLEELAHRVLGLGWRLEGGAPVADALQAALPTLQEANHELGRHLRLMPASESLALWQDAGSVAEIMETVLESLSTLVEGSRTVYRLEHELSQRLQASPAALVSRELPQLLIQPHQASSLPAASAVGPVDAQAPASPLSLTQALSAQRALNRSRLQALSELPLTTELNRLQSSIQALHTGAQKRLIQAQGATLITCLLLLLHGLWLLRRSRQGDVPGSTSAPSEPVLEAKAPPPPPPLPASLPPLSSPPTSPPTMARPATAPRPQPPEARLELDAPTLPDAAALGDPGIHTPPPTGPSQEGLSPFALLEAFPDPCFLLDPQGRIRQANAAAEQLLAEGGLWPQLEGLMATWPTAPTQPAASPSRELPQARDSATPSSHASTLRTPVGLRLEQLLQHADGSPFPVELWRLPTGLPETPFLLLLRDRRVQHEVHQLEQAMRRSTLQLAQSSLELRLSEARKAAIFEASMDCLIGLDGDGQLLELNTAARHTFDLGEASLVGKTLESLIPAVKTEEGPAPRLERRYPLGERVDVLARTARGRVFPAELTLVRIPVEGPPTYTAYLRDISTRKRLEQMKDEILSTVSHELRTPLTSIRGSLGLLEGGVLGALPAPILELIHIARQNSDRLIRMVNDMLDLDKLSAGRMTLLRQTCTTAELLLSACQGLEGMAAEAGVTVIQEAGEDFGLWVDRDRVIQVLTNLGSNAIKYSPAGEAVQLSARRLPGGRIRFQVEDHGPGIPRSQREQLFSRFHQVDASDARARRGTGLGLAISKALVELHGGEIGLESDVGLGSRFFFDLPMEEGGADGR